MLDLVLDLNEPGSVPLTLFWFLSSVPQGKPRPVVTWLKDGVPLEDRTVGTRTSEVDSILFIRSAERGHSGTYTLSVQIENMLDSADIRIQVVGRSRLLWLRLARRAPPARLTACLEARATCQKSLFLNVMIIPNFRLLGSVIKAAKHQRRRPSCSAIIPPRARHAGRQLPPPVSPGRKRAGLFGGALLG